MPGWLRLGGVGGVIALGLVTVVSAVTMRGAHAASAVMSIDPPSQNIASDSASFAVTVKVTGADNVGGWEFAVRYNKDVLEFVDVADRGYLNPLGLQVSCQHLGPPRWGDDVVDFGCGAIGTAATGPGGFTGQSGDGDLGTITFRPKKTGSSDLVFMKRTLSDPFGPGLPLESADGVVTVVDPGQSGQSLQPTPTANAALLTPTSVPPSQDDPFIRKPGQGGTGQVGSSQSGSGTPTAGGSGAQPPTGVTAPGAAASSSVRGLQLPPGSGPSASAAGGASGDQNFPHAGTGPEPAGRDARWNYATGLMFAAGAALVLVGDRRKRLARHRQP